MACNQLSRLCGSSIAGTIGDHGNCSGSIANWMPSPSRCMQYDRMCDLRAQEAMSRGVMSRDQQPVDGID